MVELTAGGPFRARTWWRPNQLPSLPYGKTDSAWSLAAHILKQSEFRRTFSLLQALFVGWNWKQLYLCGNAWRNRLNISCHVGGMHFRWGPGKVDQGIRPEWDFDTWYLHTRNGGPPLPLHAQLVLPHLLRLSYSTLKKKLPCKQRLSERASTRATVVSQQHEQRYSLSTQCGMPGRWNVLVMWVGLLWNSGLS